MFLLRILIRLCMIIGYIVRKYTFVVIFYKLFCTKEILKRHIKDRFKINDIEKIIMPKKVEYNNKEILKEK